MEKINIILTTLAILIIILSITDKKRIKSKNKRTFNLNKINQILNNIKILKNINKYLLIIIVCLLIFTTFYKFGTVPYSIHIDEAGMAYDALSLSNYGVDRYLKHYPVYLINFGGGQSAMYAYLTMILIKIFGINKIIIRLPAAILRICLFIFAYLMSKEMNNKNKTLIFVSLLSVVPYFIMQSRWGLDCNLLVGFLTISISLLVISINKNKNLLLLISGIFFGLSLYCYALSYIIIPLLLILTLTYLLILKKINIKQIILFAIPIFILAVPLMTMILINNNIINEINSFITIPKLPNYRGAEISLSNIKDNISIFKTLVSNDFLYYNSLSDFGTLYYISIPFLIIGLIKGVKETITSIKKKIFKLEPIMLIWGISVITCMLIIKEPNINKANAIFTPLVYFVSLGIYYISKNNKIILTIIILLYIINFSLFSNHYFNKYNKVNDASLNLVSDHFIDAVIFAKNLPQEIVYTDANYIHRSSMYVIYANQIDPYQFQTVYQDGYYIVNNKIYFEYLKEEIDDNAIYIIGKDKEKINRLINMEFKYKKFEYFYVLYK